MSTVEGPAAKVNTLHKYAELLACRNTRVNPLKSAGVKEVRHSGALQSTSTYHSCEEHLSHPRDLAVLLRIDFAHTMVALTKKAAGELYPHFHTRFPVHLLSVMKISKESVLNFFSHDITAPSKQG